MGMWAVLSVLLSLFVSVAYGHAGHHHVQQERLGQLSVKCKEGWKIHKAKCYMAVNHMMTWDDAKDTCHRQGGALLWIENEMEYDYVKNSISSSDTFWTGLKHDADGTAMWAHSGDEVDLKTITSWGDNEPSTDGDKCAAVHSHYGLGLKSCHIKLSFVCKYHACISGTEPCATGGQCIPESDKCDGRHDCEDHSDERDCRTEYCTHYFQLKEAAGNFITPQITDGTYCTYVLEAPIGKRIRLEVPETGYFASLEIRAGSPELGKSIHIKTLRDHFPLGHFYSMNNFMTILLQAGDITATSIPGINLSWTTDIPELPDGTETVMANNTWQSLSSPFTADTMPPHLHLDWKIEAPVGHLISYFLDSYRPSDGSSLTVHEVDSESDHARTMSAEFAHRNFFVSATNILHVYWNSGSGMSSFRLLYKTGCSMEIPAAHGFISPPHLWSTGSYPSELNCEWTLTGGKTKSRGLTVHFSDVEVEQDPRTDPKSMDHIKVYMNEAISYTEVDGPGSHHSHSGHIKVVFTSDLILNKGVGFHAEFSIDCPNLNVSDWTVITPASTSFNTDVILSCNTGYRFDAQEYHNHSQVTLHCNPGGTWSYEEKTCIRTPSCEKIQCGVPTQVNNGYIKTVTGTSYHDTVEYECNEGFAKKNTQPAKCEADGTWHNLQMCTSATCEAAAIQGVANGKYQVEAGNDITRESVDFDTVVKFVCDAGYELKGSLRSHCTNQGWSNPKPECIKLRCPLTLIENAHPFAAMELAFQDTLWITCMDGFGVNRTSSTTKMVTCQSDQKFKPNVYCSDIDECDAHSNPCDLTTTTCKNTHGSYECECLDGYKSSTSATRCDDIDECTHEKGGCSHQCSNWDGSYECGCPSGWILFTKDGTSGHHIPDSETGNKYGDIYYLNHTCVRKSCSRPDNIDHGTLLSTKALFHYEDTVMLVCEDGYHITGESETVTKKTRTCTDTGWDHDIISCTARKCSTNVAPHRGTYDKTTVQFGEMVHLTCEWTENINITRIATCVYDSGSTKFGGDDITTCPEIDCGIPVLPNGGTFDIQPSSTKYLDHPTFNFVCSTGYDLLGASESNNTAATCKENGRWSLNTLTCLGKRCRDPGTPGEAKQVVSNYEAGEQLYYTCDRVGFEPDERKNYTCQYNDLTDTATWSDNLESSLPVCKDKMKPEIINLPSTTQYRDYMEPAGFSAPTFSDNVGLKQTRHSPSIKSSDIISERKVITYTATDYEDNTETKTVTIEVIDRTVKPSLSCPNFLELTVSSDGQEDYDLTSDVSSDGTLTFDPQSVTKSVSNIGKYVRIDVTAKNSHGTEAYCSFLVTFKAGKCFQDTLHHDGNAVRRCSTGGDSSITCISTCNPGYIYGDGTSNKTFTCTGENNWDVNHPHVFCLPYQMPAYLFRATVTHHYGYLSGECESYYQSAISQQLSTFTSKMNTQCPGIQWKIKSHTSVAAHSSFDFESTFAVERVTEKSEDETTLCVDSIRNNSDIFALMNLQLSCEHTYSINVTDFYVTDAQFDCATLNYIMIEPDEKRCVPCGPSRFYENDACSTCPAGEYQDQVDGNCQECDSKHTPNEARTDCILKCPAGFQSSNGLFPCTPCPVDSFWLDSQTCTQCSTMTSTSGREGAVDVSKCYSSCTEGHYSLTGYTDKHCKTCPRNFYQPNRGQISCLECPDNEVTESVGQTNLSSCQPYAFAEGMSCDSAYCNDHGSCAFEFHRPVCTCDGGYRGERCENIFHICDSNHNPCLNGATCLPRATYLDFTCECREVRDTDICFREKVDGKEGGNTYTNNFDGLSLQECQEKCLDMSDCHSLTYITGDMSFCLIYNVIISPANLEDLPGGTHYNRNCTAFHGDHCEKDVINDCSRSSNQCSGAAMCKDKVEGYECLCPSVGGYQGEYCDQTTQPCSSHPCKNGATCTNFEDVRYQCTCQPGYTGGNCETNINECDLNSGACLYGGTCHDGVNKYTCQCATGFSGNNCEKTPDYCSKKKCLGNTCYNSLDHRSGICECEFPYYNSSGKYTYECATSFSGDKCEKTPDYHSVKNCLGNMCYNSMLEIGGICECIHSYTYYRSSGGDYLCQATSAQPCNVLDLDCVNGTCRNLPNHQARCDCEAGFTGSLCQHSIDDCIASSCNYGDCIDGHMSTSCSCWTGYSGERCDTNIDDCVGQCVSNGHCVDGVDSFHCECNAGYTGVQCETEINECSSYPCKHGGTCHNHVNHYKCTCPPGWEGDDCDTWVNHCVPNHCHNDGQCFSLTNTSICWCGGGSVGEYCQDMTSVCDILSNIDVCINGKCQNHEGTASCQCKTEPDLERCFDVPYVDKEGGNDYDIEPHSENIDLESCKQKCLDNDDCQSLSYFPGGSTMYCKIYSKKIPLESLSDQPGGKHFDRNCPTDYAGAACELTRDWCSENPCANGGQCCSVVPNGFKCDCPAGYSGITCEIAADPCSASPSPCPEASSCQSSVTEYYCQCPMGKPIIGGECRTPTASSGYIILLNNAGHSTGREESGTWDIEELTEDIPTLHTSFRASTQTFSVMFKVKVHKAPDNAHYSLLRIVGSVELFPFKHQGAGVVRVTNDKVTLTYRMNGTDEMETVTLPLGTSLDSDNDWHHVGISLSSDGYLSCTIDAIEEGDRPQLSGQFNFIGNAQVILGGAGMVAEFKHVTVWETALTNSDFAKAHADEDYTPNGTMIQGWWNYKLTKASQLLTQELQGNLYSEDKSVPAITCDSTPYETVSTNRIFQRDSLVDLKQKIDRMANNHLFSDSIPEVLSRGYYNGIVAVEGSNNRHSVCRFPVYIKYQDKCTVPEHAGDVTFMACDIASSDGVCDLSCAEDDKVISASTPRYQPCGVLGVYDWKMPHKTLVLSTCTADVPPKYIVHTSMEYKFSIACSTVLEDTQDTEELQSELRTKFKGLNSFWKNICVDAACTNLDITTPACNNDMSDRVNLAFSLTFDSDLLQAQTTRFDNSIYEDGTMGLVDALKSIIVLEQKIDLSRFGSATLLPSTVSITMTMACSAPGHNLINNRCVPCGRGLFYSNESKACEFCHLGTYSTGEGNTACTKCNADQSTVNLGSRYVTHCIEKCDPGSFYNVISSACENCSRHSYQDSAGQSFCHYCESGFVTQEEQSTSESDCKEDCPAGYQRNETGHCVLCHRGYWRDMFTDNCQKCSDGYTTLPDEHGTSSDKCSMEECLTGSYWSVENNTCQPCPVGKYQDKVAMLKCQECEGNKTTKVAGTNTSQDCVFYCAVGYEVNADGTETCVACERGYYKDNEGDSKFHSCIKCTPNKTTDTKASTSEDQCEFEICDPGYYLKEKVCTPCNEDYYQPLSMPDSSVRCARCPNKGEAQQGTNGTGIAAVDDCEPVCPGGQEFNETEMRCVSCDVGTYKPVEDRFGTCITCQENFTTDGNMKTAESDCDIPLCKKGQYVKDKVCTVCGVDTYQPNLHPAAGVTCTECPARNGVETGTRDTGAHSEDACEPICPGGEEYSEETGKCVPCPVGKFKPDNDRFGSCDNCPEGYITDGEGKTSEADCNIRNCPPGSYVNGTICIRCAHGYYQDDWRKSSCIQCGENLNTSEEGAASRDECQAFCSAGEQSTGTQDLCEPCPAGTYKPVASYDTCHECPEDRTSNEDRTNCTVYHCGFGKEYKNLSTGEDCVACPAGKYKNTTGNDACQDCPAGYTSLEPGQTACENLHCVPGKTEYNGECVLCDVGSYKEDAGNAACTLCHPSNMTTAGKGSFSQNDCNIVVCEVGHYRDPSQTTECTPCQRDYYQNETGHTSCIQCQPGKVTMQTGSTDSADCVPECQKGEQYNSTTKSCDKCPQRYYKDTVGNTAMCSQCPTGKITIGEGATERANCSQTDCQPGTHVHVVNDVVTCPPCPKGQYQPERSKPQCLSCQSGSTTVTTGSIKEQQCVSHCALGHGLIYGKTKECHPCEIGQYNNRTGENSNLCKQCPVGLTTTIAGKSSCDITDYRPARPADIVTIVFVLRFRVEIDCSAFDNIGSLIEINIRNFFNSEKSKATGLCGINESSCDHAAVTLRPCTSSRKRAVVDEVIADVVLPNVSKTVTLTVDGTTLPTANFIAKLLEGNPTDISPQPGVIDFDSVLTAPVVTPVCSPGYIIEGSGCEPCPTGQYWNNASCKACPKDTYQDEEAKVICKSCPDNQYSDMIGATVNTTCKSFCSMHPGHCNHRGTCTDIGRREAECKCDEGFSGNTCATKETPSTSHTAIVAGSIGGGALLLTIILIIVGIVRFMKDRAERKAAKRPFYGTEIDSAYDNRAFGAYNYGNTTVESTDFRDPIASSISRNEHKRSQHQDQTERKSEDVFVWQA